MIPDSNTYEIILTKHSQLLEIIDLQGKNIAKLTETVDKLSDIVIKLKKQLESVQRRVQ